MAGLEISLVPTGANGVDQGESEVKLQVREDEGSNEAAAGSIYMNPHVPTVLLVQLSYITESRSSAVQGELV